VLAGTADPVDGHGEMELTGHGGCSFAGHVPRIIVV